MFVHADLETIPVETFVSLPYLTTLDLSHNNLRSLPRGIGKCTKLLQVNLTDNCLVSLPDDFADAMQYIKILRISNNPLGYLPPYVISGPVLEELHAEAVALEDLPDAFIENNVLTVLNLGDNELDSLPSSFVHLTKVTDLNLSGVHWPENFSIMFRTMFDSLMKTNPIFAKQVSLLRLYFATCILVLYNQHQCR